MGSSTEDDGAEKDIGGRAQRTNLLLSATIETLDITAPVRIRNLSETGALLEGSALPRVGTHLVLKRLELEMGGRVIWCEGSRCGVAFEGIISVAGWRAGTWVKPVGNQDQNRVDAILASVRAGPAAPDQPVLVQDNPVFGVAQTDVQIARELTALQRILEQMGDQLSEEPVIVQKYPTSIQRFDLACQTLGHLATVLKSPDRISAIDAVGMQDLRDRLKGLNVFGS